jgi:hypothetical protein
MCESMGTCVVFIQHENNKKKYVGKTGAKILITP